MNWTILVFDTSFSRIGEYPGPTTNGLWSNDVAQGTVVEGIEKPNETDDVERWEEVDTDPLVAPNASHKDCASTIAGGGRRRIT